MILLPERGAPSDQSFFVHGSQWVSEWVYWLIACIALNEPIIIIFFSFSFPLFETYELAANLGRGVLKQSPDIMRATATILSSLFPDRLTSSCRTLIIQCVSKFFADVEKLYLHKYYSKNIFKYINGMLRGVVFRWHIQFLDTPDIRAKKVAI